MCPLVMFIFKKFAPGQDGFWTLAVDDSPTKCFGPHIEAADIHHNPTRQPLLPLASATTCTGLRVKGEVMKRSYQRRVKANEGFLMGNFILHEEEIPKYNYKTIYYQWIGMLFLSRP